MDQYRNLVFSVCLKLTGDYFTAEDITQETFISAFVHHKDFDEDTEKAWLCKVASNKCIDYNRAAARKNIATDPGELPETPDPDSGPLEQILNQEVMNQLQESIERLAEPYKSVAREHFQNAKTAKEISEETGTPLKTVQTQIYRAKDMLKKHIRKEELLT